MPVTYSCSTPSHWLAQDPSHSIPQSEEEAIARINALYDSGTPFFTKDRIRAIHDQLKKPLKKGDKISVIGLDGAKVDFDVEIGNVRDKYEKDVEFLL